MTNREKTEIILKAFSLVFLWIIIGGCARYTLISPDKDIRIGNEFRVNTPIHWSKSTVFEVETWTVDGPQLQRLMFFTGVEEGKPLFVMKGKDGKNPPLYRSGMSPWEITELLEAALARSGSLRIETMNLKPEKFGKLEGFRFEMKFTTKSGLHYKGLMAGAQKEDKLLAIMYLGTALHHYDKYLADVETLLSSLEVL